ncbi:MAG: hypothetical protein KAT05_16370 [Spirochaetes bacterium]|nr:hypothetical protein [Spirochaetota bacterium]
MTIAHLIFHMFQGLIGSFSIYALLENSIIIAVTALFITLIMELVDNKLYRVSRVS